MSEHRNRTTCVDKHEIVVDRHHTINIVVEGGMVVEVDGLPVDWQSDDTFPELWDIHLADKDIDNGENVG